MSTKYFNENKSFIDISKEFASDLYEIMRENNTIPSCDLLVCEIISEEGRILGILKLDYIKTVEHVINSTKIEIKNSTALPLSGQKVQKAAFVLSKPTEYDCIVIDKIKGKNNDTYDGEYFTKTFLDAYYVDTSIDNTKKLINETNKWVDENIGDDIESLKIKNNIKRQLDETDSINIADFSDAVVNDNFERADMLRETLSNALNTEDELTLDTNCVKSMISDKLKLKLDSIIDVTLPKELFEDTSKIELSKNGDGTTNITFKFIKEISEK